MRMMERKPVSKSTKTNELMIDNQCISNDCGKKEYCAYLLIRSSKGTSEATQRTEYENSTSRPPPRARSTRWRGSADTFTSITRLPL